VQGVILKAMAGTLSIYYLEQYFDFNVRRELSATMRDTAGR
jgi:hypothetical protein